MPLASTPDLGRTKTGTGPRTGIRAVTLGERMTAALPALGCVRIADPLTVDERGTLEALSAKFSAFRVSYDGSRWRASRKDGTGNALRGLTPDDLAAGMRAAGVAGGAAQ